MGFSGKALPQIKSLLLCKCWEFNENSSCSSFHTSGIFPPIREHFHLSSAVAWDFYNCSGNGLSTELLFWRSGWASLGVAECHLLLLIGVLVLVCVFLHALPQTYQFFFFFCGGGWEYQLRHLFLIANCCCYCENHCFHFQPSSVPQKRFYKE